MADTFTANLNLTKPGIGESTDTWGTKLNDNFDDIDALFPSGALPVVSGGTGATTASGARTNLELGTMATQAASSVAITGGTATLSTIRSESTNPFIAFYETDASTTNRNWRFSVNGEILSLLLLNDAASTSGAAFTVTRAANSASVMNVSATLQVSGNVVYHAGNISASGAAMAGSAATITGAWTFTAIPSKTSGGKFLHYDSSTQSGGAITVSTSAASGTPGAGDLWIQYVA